MFMFDAYELTLISEFHDKDGGIFCQPYEEGDENEPDFNQKIWSIYGHFPSCGKYRDPDTGQAMHGVDCLCDFRFEAENYARDVYDHLTKTLELAQKIKEEYK